MLVYLKYFGTNGVFGGITISYISIKIYMGLINNKLTIKLPKEVPTFITDSFLSIIPTLVIVIVWRIICYVLNVNVLNFIDLLFSPLMELGDSFLATIIIPLLTKCLWFVGIHGASVINSIISPITTVMNVVNLKAFMLPYLASGNFYSAYVWIGLSPLP